MVHALRETHRALRPGGTVIDLRPASENRSVELELPGARLHVGEIDYSRTFADHAAADAALRRLIDQGFFAAEHDASFQVITELDSLDDLREFAGGLRKSVLPAEVPRRIAALIADERDYRIRTGREMSIARYRRL